MILSLIFIIYIQQHNNRGSNFEGVRKTYKEQKGLRVGGGGVFKYDFNI